MYIIYVSLLVMCFKNVYCCALMFLWSLTKKLWVLVETCVARVLLLVSYKYTTSHPCCGKGHQNADGGPPKPIHGTTWHVSRVYKRVSPTGALACCSGVPESWGRSHSSPLKEPAQTWAAVTRGFLAGFWRSRLRMGCLVICHLQPFVGSFLWDSHLSVFLSSTHVLKKTCSARLCLRRSHFL